MRKLIALALLLAVIVLPLAAQRRAIAFDSTVTTKHEVTIKGQRVPYVVTTGTQPV